LVTRRSDDEEIEDEDFDLRLKQDEKWLHDSPVKNICRHLGICKK
jgi:hypothetical protein